MNYDKLIEERWQRATIKDNFIFGKTMVDNSDLCQQLIEMILNIKVAKISYPEREKAIDARIDSRGIRLDVYLEDAENRSFDLEMQVAKNRALLKRFRYYQDLIDLDKLKSGEYFDKLGELYIIFICPFKPFKYDQHMYTWKTTCVTNPNVQESDDVTKILLSAKGTANDVNLDVKDFLNYVDKGIVKGDFVTRLDKAVKIVKSMDETKVGFVKYQMALIESKLEGEELGEKRGEKRGRTKGIESVALNLLGMGMNFDNIQQATKLSLERIRELANGLAKDNASAS